MGRWLTSAVVVLLVIFAANQFATEWEAFRSSAYPTGSAIDFHITTWLRSWRDRPTQPASAVYATRENKEAVLDRIAPDTEWNQVAHQNGLGDTLHFSAPPIVATLLVPLGRLPYQLAFMVWRVLTDLFFFLAIWICLKLCQALSPATLLICTLAGFAFQPFALTLEKGQFGALLLLTWSAGVLFAEKKQDVLSALMLALATIVKLTPLLAIGVFLVRRRWKWLAFYALWMVLLMASECGTLAGKITACTSPSSRRSRAASRALQLFALWPCTKHLLQNHIELQSDARANSQRIVCFQ